MDCVRCWRCCIDAENHTPDPFLTRQFILPWTWLEGITVRICPFLGVSDGLPSCTVYEFRPTICKNYKCKRMIQDEVAVA